MRYRAFGQTGRQISLLSLGCMRFPSEEAARSIVNRAVDLGITYFETSVEYCQGNSERWLGQSLGARRELVMISTKSHVVEDNVAVSADQVRRLIDHQLEKLGTDHVDFYNAWSVSRPHQIEAVRRPGGWYDGVLRAKQEGLVRHIGVTTHATPKQALELISDGRWETVTVQYSLLLRGYRPVVQAARERGMGVMVMGPLAGGLLALPSEILQRVLAPDNQVTGAFRYVLSDPGVSSVASGMTSFEEVESNCATINALPDAPDMTHQDAVTARLDAELGELMAQMEVHFCGGCRYCLSVCPQNIGPHNIFKVYNMVMLKAHPKNAARLAEQAQALLDRCVYCGACQEICPQDINVPEHLARVRDYFLSVAANEGSDR